MGRDLHIDRALEAVYMGSSPGVSVMVDVFKIEEPNRFDKEFHIIGPDGFYIFVDYDDVDPEFQMRNAKRVVEILNKHWNECDVG